MNKIVRILSFFLFSGISLSFGQQLKEYLWPTDASRYLTSSFGEYRARRFHTGVDVKTWGTVGYKCFAVRPGYVWRASVSPYGYGRVVYLKLDTGETAVYAHLSRFNDVIDKSIEAEQDRVGKYSVNMFFKSGQIPVKQGDVIAYTGQTGIGAPHLHFEIRDASNRPINPLLKGYKLSDSVSPIVTMVSFAPLDEKSEVNKDYKPFILSPKWVRPGEYLIDDKITIWGNVGIGISCYDKSLDTDPRYGIYELKLFVDGVLRFRYSYDRIDFQNNEMVELERDYRLSRRDLGRFYKLYKDKFNVRSAYIPNKTWAGVLQSASLNAHADLITALDVKSGNSSGSLFPGEHDIRIEASDFFKNTSTVHGKIYVGASFHIRPNIVQNDANSLVLRDVVTTDLNQIQNINAHFLNGNKWQQLPFDWHDGYNEKGGSEFPEKEYETSNNILLPGMPAKSPIILKMDGYDQFGAESYPYYYVHTDAAADSAKPEIKINFDFYDDYVRLELTANNILLGVPKLILYPGRGDQSQIEIHQTDLKTYLARIELSKLNGEKHFFEINFANLSGDEFSVIEYFYAEKIDPSIKDFKSSVDLKLKVKFWPNSLYRPIYTRIMIDSLSSVDGFNKVGYVYSVEPKDVLLNKGAFVEIEYPETESNPTKLGVYYKEKDNEWIFIDNQHDPLNRTISAKVLSFEDFTLIKDEMPPEISNISPADQTRLKNRMPLISINVLDKHSGINSEDEIEIRLDGKRLIAEYDPERERLFYQVKEALVSGPHEILAMALDKCKNVTLKKSYFWIE